MLTLALETSTHLGSVAVGDGDALVAECALSVRATHSETVLDEVDRMLSRAGAAPGDIGAVVVGGGPGSFTGVRIAAALAKGLCHAGDLPLYAYSSLRVVAATAGRPRACTMFDARRGEVYVAAYEGGGRSPAALGPAVLPVEDALDAVERLGKGGAGAWSFAGEGALRFADTVEARGGEVLPAHLGIPRASALLWLARGTPDGRVEDPRTWEPAYVRASGAERGIGRRG